LLETARRPRGKYSLIFSPLANSIRLYPFKPAQVARGFSGLRAGIVPGTIGEQALKRWHEDRASAVVYRSR
jgi:hypothetical protein